MASAHVLTPSPCAAPAARSVFTYDEDRVPLRLWLPVDLLDALKEAAYETGDTLQDFVVPRLWSSLAVASSRSLETERGR